MELSGARMEDSNEYWYAIVNRLPDVAARMGSKFTAQELEFFNKVVILRFMVKGCTRFQVLGKCLINSTIIIYR